MTNAYDKITSIAVVYCTLTFGPDAQREEAFLRGVQLYGPLKRLEKHRNLGAG